MSGQWRRRRDGRRRCLTLPAPPNLPRHLPTAHRDGRWGDRRADGTWGGEPPAARLGGGGWGGGGAGPCPAGADPPRIVRGGRSRRWRSACRLVDPSDRFPNPPKRGRRRGEPSHEKLPRPLPNSVHLPYAPRHRQHHFPPVTHLATRPPVGCPNAVRYDGGGASPLPRKRWRDPRPDPERRAQRPPRRARRPSPPTRRGRVARSVRRRSPRRRARAAQCGTAHDAQCGTAHDEWAPSPQPFPRAPIPAAATASPWAGLACWCGVAPQRQPRPPSAPAPSYPRSVPATPPPLLPCHRRAPSERTPPPTPPRPTPSRPRPGVLLKSAAGEVWAEAAAPASPTAACWWWSNPGRGDPPLPAPTRCQSVRLSR